jgi:hypothetical protein
MLVLDIFVSTSSKEAINTLMMPMSRGVHQCRSTILALRIFGSTSLEEAIDRLEGTFFTGQHQCR